MKEEIQIIFKETNLNNLSFVLDLYNYYILNTTATFDYEKITLEELQTRLSYNNKKYKTFLVCDKVDEDIIGFCVNLPKLVPVESRNSQAHWDANW